MTNETTPNASAPLERRLATILCADIAGYSNLMGANEEQTVQVFRGHREIFDSLVALHRGRIFNTAGDAILVEFNSAVEAVRCATEIQAALATRNEHLAPAERMLFRIGINLGDVIVQGNDLLGDGVNVAARIQTGTEPGGIRISGSVYDQIQNKLSLDFKLLGEQTYKNIAKPVRTYSISEGAAASVQTRKPPVKTFAAIATVLIVAGAAFWGYRQYDARREEQARIQAQLMAQLEEQKQAAEQAQRAANDAKREALLQAQKQAAEEALRRAQDERKRLEQDRKASASEKPAADAPKKQTANSPVAPVALKTAAQYDGTYSGKVCIYFQGKPNCKPVALVVRNGIAEGSWTTVTNRVSTLKGTVDANGALELNLTSHTQDGKHAQGTLAGRVLDQEITASGHYRNGVAVDGNWRRAQQTPAG